MTYNKYDPILPPEGFVRLPVVLRVLGVGKTAFYLGIRDGKYPAPIKLGPRTSAWRVEDIRAVIAKFNVENASKE
ncbi:MAG: AlpA family phage regulatory protein [Planctomycetaceae bacterium]|nr:AlpA family phage regulatory protein [Planctomycetaceae bacterium]